MALTLSVESGATTIFVSATEALSVGVTIRGGFDEATKDRRVSIILVTGAAVVGARTQNSGGLGCHVSSLKVAPKL